MITPRTAMILAAGRGERMRPLSDHLPKPLLEIQGRSVIDHALDRLKAVGVTRVVVNLHYKGDMIRGHLARRPDLEIAYSDESERVLDTGGGVLRALPQLGPEPFFVINGDALWFDSGQDMLAAMARRYDPGLMDALLLLQPVVGAIGYRGIGDFNMDPDGRLRRRPEIQVAPFVFTGVQLLSPALFRDAPEGPFSINLLYDRAEEAERLFGIRHEGDWMQLNSLDGLAAAQRALSGA